MLTVQAMLPYVLVHGFMVLTSWKVLSICSKYD